MPPLDAFTTSLATTHATLRATFPADFHKRCMYAAFGVASLLEDAGIPAEVAGGDFLCAVVSRDGQQLSLQGFGTPGASEPSHYWVCTPRQLIDPGPAYLPYESPFPAASLPALSWSTMSPLPGFIAYRERVRVAADAMISTTSIAERVAAFVAACRAHRDSQQAADHLPYWQLRDLGGLAHWAQKRDPWALAARSFLRRGLKAQFPSP